MQDYLDWINLKTPKLADCFFTLSTKLYWIFNGFIDFPKCLHCSKVLDFKNVSLKSGYGASFCSIKCIANSPIILRKKENTCEKKYGKGIKNTS